MRGQTKKLLPEAFHINAVYLIIGAMILLLVLDRLKTSLVFLLASAALLLTGILDTADYFAGFSNLSILTIFLLIIITGGINENFNLARVFSSFFKGVKGPRSFIWRMGLGVAGFSAFMNNTPVVAVMMPHVYKWGRDHRVSPSKLLMPLSFAAILGGVITLIGTSTNLVLNGLMEQSTLVPLAFADFLWPGLSVTLGGILIMVFLAPYLLKSSKDLLSSMSENKREYLVETRINQHNGVDNQTVEAAQLRNLEGVFLTEIVRENRVIAPVSPKEVLKEGDVLLFAGETANIMELVKERKWLELSKTTKFNLIEDTEVVEAVVAQNSALDRRSVKDVSFREKYDAAIIGIHRRGEKLSGKIGQIDLRTGDLLLLVAGREFAERNARTEDMIVINKIPAEKDLPLPKKAAFLISTAVLIGLSIAGIFSLFEVLLGIGLAQLLLGMLSLEGVKRSISLDLLIILISALALGEALIETGAAQQLTSNIFAEAHTWEPLTTLLVIFGATFLLTSFVTNVAAISIIFPVVLSLAGNSALPAHLLFLTAAYGASCCFITPYAYQTNLMVMELGKYRFNDYLRLGTVVSAIYALAYFAYVYFAYLL